MKACVIIFMLSIACKALGRETLASFAHCRFRYGDNGPKGHICFKEVNGNLTSNIKLRNVSECSSFKIHIHENGVNYNDPAQKCTDLGGHYNILDENNIDEGDMGCHNSFSSRVLVVSSLQINQGLSLQGENSIVERSVAIHDGDNKICCHIKSCDEATFNRMLKRMNKFKRPKNKCEE